MKLVLEVKPFDCDSCGERQTGEKAPYVDRLRYSGKMCENCWRVKLWLFDPQAPTDVTKLPGWAKKRDLGTRYLEAKAAGR